MLIRCPACGAENSLDTLIDDEQASKALQLALELSPIGKLIIRYLGLFRPAKTKLTWNRVTHLLDELLPMIKAQSFVCNRVVITTTMMAWELGLQAVLTAREHGKLKLPLKNHNYLLQVVATEASRIRTQGAGVLDQVATADKPMTTTPNNVSNTAKAVLALEKRRHK